MPHDFIIAAANGVARLATASEVFAAYFNGSTVLHDICDEFLDRTPIKEMSTALYNRSVLHTEESVLVFLEVRHVIKYGQQFLINGIWGWLLHSCRQNNLLAFAGI